MTPDPTTSPPQQQYEFHEAANLFPLMTDEDYDGLKKDIQEHGLRDPIWIYDGKIIDGRNRYRACTDLGIPIHTREWDGDGSLVDFVVSLNFHRRHLTPSQRAAIAAKMMPMFEAEAKERKIEAGRAGGKTAGRGRPRRDRDMENLPEPYPKGKTSRQRAAEALKVNEHYVQDVKQIQTKSPELVDKICRGELSIQKAKAQVRPTSQRRCKGVSASKLTPALGKNHAGTEVMIIPLTMWNDIVAAEEEVKRVGDKDYILISPINVRKSVCKLHELMTAVTQTVGEKE